MPHDRYNISPIGSAPSGIVGVLVHRLRDTNGEAVGEYTHPTG